MHLVPHDYLGGDKEQDLGLYYGGVIILVMISD